ncbi:MULTISPECIES: NCS2 family permease [unclassified Herbaspirillum]|uniref:NCS2 family permease n=1 Tax=unclassified Herbaspirillum TaxID=2624150 RepID=UPI001152FF50|nr:MULTISPECIES: NCS2 family permease [unclassified Herbaspirillum]MBB5391957.1 AGZA family xanthine/uracil permease-like MFS transporter [Herbaspirillum sp. SJZ102]TQK13417.1 AGZA family xanthine/uracil permease-like MFS transporter [Herbaspirillum sp. SJZ130]TQK15421.1 AGZA family xanthine/uracil permease-like MFS transporter [Herbaspirillum sp. SJZ106]TWC71316.1 AGZA family xanthine/uracil permease-like MFS transporter [Herbaspirillum sp. SJZ099]
MNALDNYFKLSENGTTVRTELLAGLTTFLTMAYIIFVNPSILGDAGMPKDSVFVATCLAAAIGTLIMGLYANYPIGLAPGMGLNAYFAYAVVKGMGFPWQAALGAVLISGCLFLVVSLLRVRELIIKSIPKSLRTAIPAGIGLFLAIISLKSAGIIAANPATFVTMGDLHQPAAVMAIIGFLVIVALDKMKVRGALLIGILLVTVLSFLFGGNHFSGVFAPPPSLAPTFLQLDVKGALSIGLLNVVLVFFLVELFDATGTLMGVAQRAGLMKEGKMDRLNKALMADSTAIVAGSLLGTSSTTAYIESAAGVQAGGRTGLTAVAIAVLFLLCLFIAPLAGVVPAYATAPALFFVACLMVRELVHIDWDDTTECVPAVITALVMPFTYSIANGLALGFISYAGLKLLTGRVKDVSVVIWIIAAIFLFKLIYLGE